MPDVTIPGWVLGVIVVVLLWAPFGIAATKLHYGWRKRHRLPELSWRRKAAIGFLYFGPLAWPGVFSYVRENWKYGRG